jgi:indole-3-glycerol phosphate synthase
MDRLREILEHKRTEITRLLPRTEMLRAAALQRNDFRGFGAAINRGPDAVGLIAEVKKASPSAGAIVGEFDPVRIAQTYEAAGAHAVSVLTDERFFQGNPAHLTRVRAAIGLPVLRKDFILHEAQIFEAACAGADAILLIVAALSQEELVALHGTAELCQLDVLVEVHTLEELERAVDCHARIIGINNRNLATFEVDLATTERLAEEAPDDVILVSESGIRTGADARRVFEAGADALLVGEALMRAPDVSARIGELLGIERQQ